MEECICYLVNTSLYLIESFKYEICICVGTRKEGIDSEKFQNHWLNIIYTNIHVHTPKELMAKPNKFKVIQNIKNVYFPKDSERIPSTMVSVIIYIHLYHFRMMRRIYCCSLLSNLIYYSHFMDGGSAGINNRRQTLEHKNTVPKSQPSA